MPELPEVETVRKVLEKWVIDKTITDVEFFYNGVLDGINKTSFINNIKNQKIKAVDRKGKFLLFKLSDYILISHLRMEGKYYLVKENVTDPKINKHKIISFTLDDGNKLIYHDVRKFGKMKLIKYEEESTDKSLSKLGEEPFSINEEELYKKIKSSKRKIKTLLLDQAIIAGLGNIYVDEVLFFSNIHPNREGESISKKENKKIIEHSIKVLNRAIELGGSSVYSYHFAGSVSGKFQNELQVYGRKDLECFKCGSKIAKTKIGGRGTHFCPRCQK